VNRVFSRDTPVTRPEFELLLCCARTRLDAPVVNQIRTILRGKVDWEYLIQMARRHQTMPLLYRNLRDTCPEAVPEEPLRQLGAYFQFNARQNLARTAELLRLSGVFEAAAVAALPFKGPVLAASVYGSLSLREFNDLDFLVPRRDFHTAIDLLLADGYRLETDFGWETHLSKPATGMWVDLHRSVTPGYFPDPFRFDQLWARRECLSLQGRMVPAACPEDLLLILSAQWGKDCCNRRPRVAQLCDSAELLRAYPRLDWSRVFALASSSGVRRIVHLYIGLAAELLGGGIPTEFRRGPGTTGITGSLRSEALEWLLRETDNHPAAMKPGELWTYPHRFHLRMRERLRDKAGYLLWRARSVIQTASTPNERDFASVRLPDSLRFLYYVIRPFRVLKTYRRGLISQLRARLRNPS
jgi:putative nucleotidyltransferase-like protein